MLYSCLARKVAVVSDMCDVLAGAAWADLLYSLLYIPLYRKLLYKAENRCIRRYTSDTHCVTALHSYTAIQRYTALYIIQLYSAIHYTTSTTALWAGVVCYFYSG
jgi:hypothetical protein